MPKEKEYLYIGHYFDTDGNYMLKVGTTNDLNRRRQEHNRSYHRAKIHTMPKEEQFVYDFTLPLSKYNTLRFEDRIRQKWRDENIGEFVRNDRFKCEEKPDYLEITIRKTYRIDL